MGDGGNIRTTLRGLKRGQVYDNATHGKVKCVVFCDALPSFLICSSFLYSFTPILIIASKDLIADLKLLRLPHTVISGIDSMNTAFVLETARTCKISFIDRPINATLCEWLIGVGIRTSVTTQIPRRIQRSWARHVTDISHYMYGGVTNFTT